MKIGMKEQLRNWFFVNLANAITTARFIFSAWLIVLAIFSEELFLMFVLVILCGITDAFDGWTARRFKITSQIGGVLDRMADKIFICPTIVILASRFWPLADIYSTLIRILTTGLVGVVILLEVFLITAGVFGLIRGVDTSSNRWGKKKMMFQVAAIFVWFLSLVIEYHIEIKIFFISIYVINIILIIAIGLAVKSIGGYWERWKWKSQQKI